jgi:hypothetical protein
MDRHESRRVPSQFVNGTELLVGHVLNHDAEEVRDEIEIWSAWWKGRITQAPLSGTPSIYDFSGVHRRIILQPPCPPARTRVHQHITSHTDGNVRGACTHRIKVKLGRSQRNARGGIGKSELFLVREDKKFDAAFIIVLEHGRLRSPRSLMLGC